MIKIVDKKKLNKHSKCSVSRPRDLYRRYGNRIVDSSFESAEDVVPMNLSKLESMEYLDVYDRSKNQIYADTSIPSDHPEKKDDEVSD